METILVKIFATALALSQVATTPDAVKTQFDRVQDQEQVAQLLHAGCTHMRKAFDIEDINLVSSQPPWMIHRPWARTRCSEGSILPICKWLTGSSARMRGWWR